MSKNRVALMMLAASVAFAAPVFADNDPTVQQIYEEAKAGHLGQAQTMIDQVLRDHPTSSKAHYIAAEIAAKRGNLSLAREELKEAQTLDPGLTKENPQAVRALKAELGGGERGAALIAPAAHRGFPWGTVLLIGGVIGVLFLIFRRRNPPVVYQGGGFPGTGGMAPVGGGPNPYGGPGYGAPAGGIGSGIAGGLASGLAVGAGVVAGEELAHHFLDGRREGVAPAADFNEPPAVNGDMGGNDFGVNDPGSWDDSGGGGGGGGDDWS